MYTSYRKKVLAVLLFLVINSCVVLAQGKYGGGTGEPNDPYQIWDANHMQAIGAEPNDWDKHFVLMDDIDLSQFDGKDGRPEFNRIGHQDGVTTSCLPKFVGFSGVFDGAGHTISNYTSHQGLFAVLDGAEIRDLGLTEPNVHAIGCYQVGALAGDVVTGSIINCYATGIRVHGECGAGGLVGNNGSWLCRPGGDSRLSYCYVSGEISGDERAGGLVGENAGHIRGCMSSCNVTGHRCIGGLVGINALAGNYWDGEYSGRIDDCHAIGYVAGTVAVGGLLGDNYGDVSHCYSMGDVAGRGSIGGLAGNNSGVLTDCYATGTVDADASTVGGLVGSNRLMVSRCYSTGDVFAWEIAGGLAGHNVGTILDCYSTGDVSIHWGDVAGGLVGENGFIDFDYVYGGHISNSYATGGGESYWGPGGLVGRHAHGEIENSYWDIQSGGLEWSDGGEPKTTAEMEKQSTFTDWDFINTWDIGENQTYPYLRTHAVSDINKDNMTNFLDLCILAEQWMREE